MSLTPERLQLLLHGVVEPTDTKEKCLVIAYERAKLGDILFNVQVNFPIDFDTLDYEELEYLYLGYSLGQKVYTEFELDNLTNDDKVH